MKKQRKCKAKTIANTVEVQASECLWILRNHAFRLGNNHICGKMRSQQIRFFIGKSLQKYARNADGEIMENHEKTMRESTGYM